jgi:hypothetical protein
MDLRLTTITAKRTDTRACPCPGGEHRPAGNYLQAIVSPPLMLSNLRFIH